MPNKLRHLRAPGETYNHFKLIKSVPIQELQCTLIELIHEPSGAQIMHIENNDTENLFCLFVQNLCLQFKWCGTYFRTYSPLRLKEISH